MSIEPGWPQGNDGSAFSGLGRMDEASQDLPSGERPSVLIAPVRDNGHFIDFQPFNPRTISTEAFKKIPGSIQDFALKYLIREGDVEALARLRPDFEMQYPLSDYEIRLTDAIDQITQRDEPIEAGTGDGLFSYIKSFISTIPRSSSGELLDAKGAGEFREKEEAELARALEVERIWRQEHPGDLFYPRETIGSSESNKPSYKPARRYRRLLEVRVEREKEEEVLAAQKAKEEADRRRAYDESVAQRPPRVAVIRPDLKIVQPEAA